MPVAKPLAGFASEELEIKWMRRAAPCYAYRTALAFSGFQKGMETLVRGFRINNAAGMSGGGLGGRTSKDQGWLGGRAALAALVRAKCEALEAERALGIRHIYRDPGDRLQGSEYVSGL
ncbi:hypothetical protein NDU88_001136 [Pleurodeles waltl]|uniref:Uncharacterized protein n=1 Tax=Pleurodeles waltl TaxID=8319 RepID=A0AAV7R7Q0_PLEWA|nr:hypothetical protein NDU88_001136 [Pleurodeles waltl]